MGRTFEKIVQRLQQLEAWRRHAADQAAGKVAQANQVIEQIAGNGLVHDAVFLGNVIYRRTYPPRVGGWDSHQLLQAALCIPGGIGVVFWDSMQYDELFVVENGLEADARSHFVPFDRVESALQAFLLPEIEPLLRRLPPPIQ